MVEKHYVLVVKNSCPHCVGALDLLRTKGKSFIYTDMEYATQALEETKKQSDWETVPMVWEQVVDWSSKEQQVVSSQFVGGLTDLQDRLEQEDD